jgi:hypothetical protein
MTNYQKTSTAKTTIWKRTADGLQLVRTIPGLPYGTSQTIHVEEFGKASLSGTRKTGSGAGEVIDEDTVD